VIGASCVQANKARENAATMGRRLIMGGGVVTKSNIKKKAST